jgi:hypothetical protein
MRLARSSAAWLTGWLTAAAAVFGLIAAWVYANGGVFHRTAACFRDMNIYAAAIFAGAGGLLVVLVYWALGASTMRLRLVRLAGVAFLVVPVGFLGLLAAEQFVRHCTGALG